VLDYLVTDAFAKSGGAVDFPGRYAEGYGYLQQKIYGDRPGKVHDTAGLWLWMPRGAVSVEHPELNYITARGAGTFAVVLTNQSKAAVTSTVALGRERLQWSAATRVTVWENNRRLRELPLAADGRLSVSVAPEGITTLVLTGVASQSEFQAAFQSAGPKLPAGSSGAPGFRGAKAVALRLGGGLTSVYAYLPDFDREITRCTLQWRQGARSGTIEDTSFPFDFTVVPTGDEPVEYSFAVQLKNGAVEKSPVGTVPLR
jgi:hypothetical protein